MSIKKSGLLLGEDSAGVNQILPHVNKWAWDLYKKGKNMLIDQLEKKIVKL